MKTKKYCTRPGCNKALNSNNTKGACSLLAKCGGRGREVAGDEIDVPVIRRTEPLERFVPKPRTDTSDSTIRRFRLLADALGFDADQVLAEFAETWLKRANAAVRATLVGPPPPRPAQGMGGAVFSAPPLLALDGEDLEEEDTRATNLLRQTAEMRIGGKD